MLRDTKHVEISLAVINAFTTLYAQPGVAPQEVLNRIALPTKHYIFFCLYNRYMYCTYVVCICWRAFVEASAVANSRAFIKCLKIIEILYFFGWRDHKRIYFSHAIQIKVGKLLRLPCLNYFCFSLLNDFMSFLYLFIWVWCIWNIDLI